MDVLVGIGMLVMMPMMGRPPQRALLGRRAPQKSEAKLEPAARLVTPMGEVAMKSTGDAELPDEEHKGTKRHGFQVNSGPKHRKTSHVNRDKKDAGKGDAK